MMTVLMVMKKKMMMRMTMMIAVMVMVRTPAIACKTWENVVVPVHPAQCKFKRCRSKGCTS